MRCGQQLPGGLPLPLTPDRILRINAVLERTGLSRSTMYRKMPKGTYPPNVRISERCAGWLRNPMFYSVDDQPGG